MSHNPVENYFLAEAIRTLRPRYEAVYGPVLDQFYLNRGGLRFMVIQDGQNKGKLTIAIRRKGEHIPDPDIEPVDCYNLLDPDETLASALDRIREERKNATPNLQSLETAF